MVVRASLRLVVLHRVTAYRSPTASVDVTEASAPNPWCRQPQLNVSGANVASELPGCQNEERAAAGLLRQPDCLVIRRIAWLPQASCRGPSAHVIPIAARIQHAADANRPSLPARPREIASRILREFAEPQ